VKVDFKKTLASYKARHGQFVTVDVPVMQYLMVDGHAGPTSADFSAAIEALYPLAYRLKFMSKLELQKDYVVPPLEALWWAEDMRAFTTAFDQSKWDWTVMLMLPEWINQPMFDQALQETRAKKSLPALSKIRLAELHEGLCVQTLHIGPFAEEGPVLQTMHNQFIAEQGFSMRGKHHEIYFNDFRKTAAEKLRTILRQPISKVLGSS